MNKHVWVVERKHGDEWFAVVSYGVHRRKKDARMISSRSVSLRSSRYERV